MEITVYPDMTTSEFADMCILHGQDGEHNHCPSGYFSCLLYANKIIPIEKQCKDITTDDWEKLFNPEE